MTEPYNAADIKLLDGLGPHERANFREWMRQLDEESARRGFPYGPGSLWKTTGAKCWYVYFEDGDSPSSAIDEDMEYG